VAVRRLPGSPPTASSIPAWFASRGHDLRSLLRGDGSDDEIAERLITIWTRRTDRYSELRTVETRPLSKVEMSRIGG
jgi:cyclic pyranopterin phosphate synthase